jgi:hypothetical protein
MSFLQKFLLFLAGAFIAVVTLVYYLFDGASVPNTPPLDDKTNLAQTAINETPTSGSVAYDNEYGMFTIVYPNELAALQDGPKDSQALIVNLLHAEMAAGGHGPFSSTWAWVEFRVSPGVTGQARVATVGKAWYSSTTDEVTYSPCRYTSSWSDPARCPDPGD